MKNPRHSDLMDFCQVVEHGGIGAAARALERPKSSLSLAIRRLEEDLEVRLVDRAQRSFGLTTHGEELARQASPLLRELQQLTAAFSHSGARVRGLLRIAAPYEFGAHHLGDIIRSLVAANPELQVVLDVQYAPIKDLIARGYDVIFAMSNGNLLDSGVVSCRKFMIERALFAAPDFLAAHPAPRTPAQLSELALIASSQDQIWRFSDGARHAHEISVAHARLISSNADVRRQAAINGLGITRTVASYCARAVAAGQLVQILPHYQCAPLCVYGVVNERRLMPASVKALFDELERQAPDLFIETKIY